MPDSRLINQRYWFFSVPCLLAFVVYRLRSQKGCGQKGCGQKGCLPLRRSGNITCDRSYSNIFSGIIETFQSHKGPYRLSVFIKVSVFTIATFTAFVMKHSFPCVHFIFPSNRGKMCSWIFLNLT